MRFICLVVVLACVCSFVYANGEGERTHFLEAFPSADKREFRNVAVEAGFPHERNVETHPFLSACPSLPVPPDTNNVNSLKPGHVRVVMSMGDSITAAMSAKDTNIANLHEYRGISYAIGGDTGALTLPNVLKLYTQQDYPRGVSTGIGKRPMATNGLNAAVSGAISSDMPAQAEWLVAQLKSHTTIDLNKDWKVLTIWIGSNNLCALCNNEANNNAADFRKHVSAALEYLYAHVPRLFVNLLANMDITKLYDIKSGLCGTMHPVECPCGSANNIDTRTHVQNTVKQYISTAYEIAANFTARKNPEFTVVVQPFLQNAPIYNRTYLSAADCFHPSAICHEAISTGLWNAMITPAAKKKTTWEPTDVPLCATADSYLYTN